MMEMVHEGGKLTSLEVVEVNTRSDARTRTSRLAVGLIASNIPSFYLNHVIIIMGRKRRSYGISSTRSLLAKNQ